MIIALTRRSAFSGLLTAFFLVSQKKASFFFYQMKKCGVSCESVRRNIILLLFKVTLVLTSCPMFPLNYVMTRNCVQYVSL